jgi:hypothetical protein
MPSQYIRGATEEGARHDRPEWQAAAEALLLVVEPSSATSRNSLAHE